jgi:hypothetical protein
MFGFGWWNAVQTQMLTLHSYTYSSQFIDYMFRYIWPCLVFLICSFTMKLIFSRSVEASIYSAASVVERLSSRTNRFPNIKQKRTGVRTEFLFPSRQTGNQVREMYGGRASVTSQPPLSAASCSNLLCLFLIFFVFCCFYQLLLNEPPWGHLRHQLFSVQIK